jgi:hypothetical protein
MSGIQVKDHTEHRIQDYRRISADGTVSERRRNGKKRYSNHFKPNRNILFKLDQETCEQLDQIR